jgi:hypothetical protein
MAQTAVTYSVPQQGVVKALAEAFYACVPTQYRTYCALTSRISARVLAAFGLAPKLVPCQLWCATPTNNYVIGFVGAPASGRWDGHVVCVVGNQLIDAATAHIRNEFHLPAPDLVVAPLIQIPSQVMSRHDLDERNRIWWHRAPEGLDLQPPAEPTAVTDAYATALIGRIRERQELQTPG